MLELTLLCRKASGNRPKSCHVQSKARELYLTYGYSDMKCSYGWFKRWSQRFQIQLPGLHVAVAVGQVQLPGLRLDVAGLRSVAARLPDIREES